MTTGNRINLIRKSLGYTLESFGANLGVTKVAISRIEKGERNLTDQMAKAICREYNVNPDYLLYGKGEMFDRLPDCILDELCQQYHMDELDRSIIEGYMQLSQPEREVVKKYIRSIAENTSDQDDSATLNAAHDAGATAAQKKHADDIMRDPSEWE